MGVLRRRACWKEGDVELLVVVLLLVVDEVVVLQEVLQDAVEGGGGAGCACEREGCRCHAGCRRRSQGGLVAGNALQVSHRLVVMLNP